jgi:hypothetical protein
MTSRVARGLEHPIGNDQPWYTAVRRPRPTPVVALLVLSVIIAHGSLHLRYATPLDGRALATILGSLALGLFGSLYYAHRGASLAPVRTDWERVFIRMGSATTLLVVAAVCQIPIGGPPPLLRVLRGETSDYLSYGSVTLTVLAKSIHSALVALLGAAALSGEIVVLELDGRRHLRKGVKFSCLVLLAYPAMVYSRGYMVQSLLILGGLAFAKATITIKRILLLSLVLGCGLFAIGFVGNTRSTSRTDNAVEYWIPGYSNASSMQQSIDWVIVYATSPVEVFSRSFGMSQAGWPQHPAEVLLPGKAGGAGANLVLFDERLFVGTAWARLEADMGPIYASVLIGVALVLLERWFFQFKTTRDIRAMSSYGVWFGATVFIIFDEAYFISIPSIMVIYWITRRRNVYA